MGWMYKTATVRVLAATLLAAAGVRAQVPGGITQTAAVVNPSVSNNSWHRIGNALIDRSLAGLATGPVDRVWYSPDGSRLLIRTSSGNIFATSDFETWQAASGTPPASPSAPISGRLPEAQAQTRAARTGSSR